MKNKPKKPAFCSHCQYLSEAITCDEAGRDFWCTHENNTLKIKSWRMEGIKYKHHPKKRNKNNNCKDFKEKT